MEPYIKHHRNDTFIYLFYLNNIIEDQDLLESDPTGIEIKLEVLFLYHLNKVRIRPYGNRNLLIISI